MIEAMKANAEAARRRTETYADSVEYPRTLRKRAFKRLVIAVLITGAVGSVAAYALIGLVAGRVLCN